jgi:hypothetical protein
MLNDELVQHACMIKYNTISITTNNYLTSIYCTTPVIRVHFVCLSRPTSVSAKYYLDNGHCLRFTTTKKIGPRFTVLNVHWKLTNQLLILVDVTF